MGDPNRSSTSLSSRSRPRPPHLCVLDFSDNLIDGAITKGYQEARGTSPEGEPSGRSFRKELGEPVFLNAEEK